ncbi:hypothetical protein ES706_00056 [subsurface metagenome]|nr:hypothetical protein [Hadesarchaea archaeon]
MKTQRESDLLIDLAKLLKKYGPETFEALASTISSPETTQHLSAILAQVARTGRTTPKTKEGSQMRQRPSVPRSLVALERAEPQKYRLLMGFHTSLVEKKILPSLRDIVDFAMECGLPEVRAKSRKDVISPLIGSLAKLPIEQLTEKIQLRNHAGDRSLEGWGNIILKTQ